MEQSDDVKEAPADDAPGTMEQSYDVKEAPADDETPSVEDEKERAKLYLQKFCPEAGDNLYDHLSEVLSRILSERPSNPFASFEEYSRRLRDDKYRKGDYLRGVYKPPPQYRNAVKLIELFKESRLKAADDDGAETLDDDASDESEEVAEALPNMLDLMYYFEQNGVGLPRSELVILNLSIRKLVAAKKIKNVRFWGKILGRPKNYYILEANLSDSELERRLEELEERENENSKESVGAEGGEFDKENAEKAALEAAMGTGLPDLGGEEAEAEEDDDTLKLVFPPIPENTWKPPPEVASERLGTGANAKVYFVCNSPGLDSWVELPSVTPQQIVVAREIVHLFTGNLETKIHSFPPFPGNEKNYLRAQIARIGAATQVSPIGYFKFGAAGQEDEDEEEEEEADEEEEEGEEGSGVIKNRRYEPLPLKELIDPSLSNWCHHSRYLLKQGRVKWLAPGKADGEGESDEEEGEEEEEEEGEEGEEEGAEKGFEKEIGPPLLTPLSEDAASEFLTPWTLRQSSTIQPDTAVAFIRSNVWPGAFAFAADKALGNLYIGWGHKHHVYNYSPPALPEVQDQYSVGAELEEIRDPSFEEEEAYRIAHLPPLDDGEEYEGDEKSEEDDDDED